MGNSTPMHMYISITITLLHSQQYHSHTSTLNTAIMDSGNNKQHLFNTPTFFPLGYTMRTINITGVSGTQARQVGIGTAYFTTTLSNNTPYTWTFPNSIYDPHCPVNLLCMDLFHFNSNSYPTGHKVSFIDEQIQMRFHHHISMPRDTNTHLYNVTLHPLSESQARQLTTSSHSATPHNMHLQSLLHDEACNHLVMFKHTELQPMNTKTALRILNNPSEEYFNRTIQHQMLDHTTTVKRIKQVNRAKRPDSYWAGRMTSRNVPQRSRRPRGVKITPGSHIVSDIGEIPIPDRHGNKYYVLFKDLCTQYRSVYRMKTKDELANVYRQFLADNRCRDILGTIKYRTRYLVTDDDVMYVKGEVARINSEHLICKYTLAPYTHNANPAESEMRKIMEGAVSNLHDSGMPPSFLLDALSCHIECMNRIYTPIYHDVLHRFQTPFQRYYGTKPSIHDVARFGCKTHVFVPKSERSKPEAHAWVGWYVGPSKCMRGCRVYRPCTHKVYDRYHTLHDSGYVYGDFLGSMYTKRVETDKQQRDYFNQEVADLLRAPTHPDRPTVTDIIRTVPWSTQPNPDSPTPPPRTPSAMPPPPTRRRLRPRRTNVHGTPTPIQTPTTPVQQTPTASQPPSQSTPIPQRPPNRTSSASTSTPTVSAQTSENPARARARRLLQGIQPHKLLHVIEAIDLTVQYMNIRDHMSHTHAHSHEAPLDISHSSNVSSRSHSYFINLCESTSKRIANSKEPTTLKQIEKLINSNSIEGSLIKDAMLEEVMWMVQNSKVKPKDKRTVKDLYEIDGKWVIKYKKTLEGLLDRVRARWVLRGDKQRAYRDYDPARLYSPVASRAGTSTALILAVQYSLNLYAIDVSKAFTASTIDRDGVHMQVPSGLAPSHPDYAPHGTHTTWELLTTLYGLRQASSTYYDKFTSVLLAHVDSKGQKYRRSKHDPCVFTKGTLGTDDYITFSVHVDDKFIACSTPELADELVTVLANGGLVANLEDMNKVLGYKVKYSKYDPGIPGSGTLEIDHKQYIEDAYNEHKSHFKDASRLSIPMSNQHAKAFHKQPVPEFCKERYKLFRTILGKVAHCANFTHPECSVSVSMLSQNMMNPSALDLELVFRVLRYLYNCTHNNQAKLTYRYNPAFANLQNIPYNPIHLLCDADLAACIVTRRSRTGHSCYLFGNLSAWSSKRQQSVSLSTAEAEYVALSACAKLGLWYRGLVGDMGLDVSLALPIVILSDSQSALNIASSPVGSVSKYSKHIDQRVHWFKELIQNGKLNVRFIPGDDNIADIFTKNLPSSKFIKFRDSLLHGDFRNLANTPSECIVKYLSRDYPFGLGTRIPCSCCDSAFSFITTTMKEYLHK